VDDGIFEGLYGLFMLLLPNKCHAFMHEVNKGVSDRWIIVDPNPHEASGAKECLNIGECFVGGPVLDVHDLQIVRNVAFIVALVAQNYDFWYCYKQFCSRDSGTGTADVVEDVMEVEQVLPDKLLNARVIWDGLILTTVDFVLRCRSFDAAVVSVWPGDMGDLRFQQEGDILMKDHPSVGLALRKAGKVHSTDGWLNGGEVMGGNVESMVVIAHKQVEHAVTCSACHGFNKLVSQRQDSWISDHDHIEGLKIAHKMQCTALLFHAEPLWVIWGIRMLIYTSCELILKYLDDLTQNASWDGDVSVGPGDVFDNRNLYWWEILVSELTLLVLCPSKPGFIDLENVLQQFEFLWAEEVMGIELEGFKPLLCEVYTRHEFERQVWEGWQWKEWVLRDVADAVEVFWQWSWDRAYLLHNLFVCKGQSWEIVNLEWGFDGYVHVIVGKNQKHLEAPYVYLLRPGWNIDALG
jgi:hypothetical protein